jgi:DNA polymerase III delta subunit
MSTFSAWWKSFRKTSKLRPVFFICGPERVLVEDVVSMVKTIASPKEWNYEELDAALLEERAIWPKVFTAPFGEKESRVVVVRNAHLLIHLYRLVPLLKVRKNPMMFLVLVGDTNGVPRKPRTEEQIKLGKQGDLVPGLDAMSGKGYIIECRPFTQATALTAVDWVISKVSMPPSVAGQLLNRANGDLRLVRDTLAKIRLLGLSPTMGLINELFSAQPRDSFVNALLAVDKKTALAALSRMSPQDYPQAVGQLLSSVKFAEMVNKSVAEHASDFDIAKRAGSRAFLVPDVKPVARFYNKKRVSEILTALADADDVLRRGQTTGVLEMLVTRW